MKTMFDTSEIEKELLLSALPCPFCGTAPEYIEEDSMLVNYDEDKHSDRVENPEEMLTGDEIELDSFAVYCAKCCIKGQEKTRAEDAISAWNTRY
ncbi:MAG: Lar family restriction alleviation protein [Chroococcidiopsis sp.]